MHLPLTLTEIKNLKLDDLKEWFCKLGLDIPDQADVEYLRSNLRLLKLTGDVIQYENKLAIGLDNVLKSLPTPDKRPVRENIYEDVDAIIGSSDSFSESVDSEISSMAVPREKVPFFHPGNFSGRRSESVEAFLKRYERAVAINNWDNAKAKLYLPIYLTDIFNSWLFLRT